VLEEQKDKVLILVVLDGGGGVRAQMSGSIWNRKSRLCWRYILHQQQIQRQRHPHIKVQVVVEQAVLDKVLLFLVVLLVQEVLVFEVQLLDQTIQ
jgi:hypothetical protein